MNKVNHVIMKELVKRKRERKKRNNPFLKLNKSIKNTTFGGCEYLERA